MRLHTEYMREQIPALVGDTFNRGKWLAGHLVCPTQNPKHIVLLVTLSKKDLPDEYGYKDGFISTSLFNWQSQNSTTQASNKGQQLINHADNNLKVQLFVRASKKIKGKAAPFTYCGELDCNSVRGNKPMSVSFELLQPLTQELFDKFKG